MRRYSRTVRIKGKTKRLPIAKLPDNWSTAIEGHIKRLFKRPAGSARGKIWALKQSPPIFGALRGLVDESLVKLWMHAADIRLQGALHILETNECAEAARWFVSAAHAAEGGLIADPDHTEDRTGSALPFLAIEIIAIAEIASADEFWRKIHLTADDADLRAGAVRLLQRDGNRFFRDDQFEAALEFYSHPIHHRPKGRPARRTAEAILQLTEMNLKIFEDEVFEATAALFNIAFPKEKAWSNKSVEARYSEIRKSRNAQV